MVDKSNSYERFKLIDKTKLAVFQRSMNDSINSVKSRLEAEKQTVKTHENTIKTLNDNITELQTTLDETKNQKIVWTSLVLCFPKVCIYYYVGNSVSFGGVTHFLYL